MTLPRGSSPRRPAPAACVAALLAAGCAAPLAYRAQDADPKPDVLDAILSGDKEQEGAEAFDEEAYASELERLYAEDQGEEVDAELSELLAEAGEGEGEEQPAPEPELNPYEEFGERIVWYKKSGFVMKPFSFPPGMGAVAQGLLRDWGSFKVWATPKGLGDDAGFPTDPQPEDSIIVHLVPGYEREAYSAPRGPNLSEPTPVELGDWLLVTAMPDQLRRVERFLETFLSSVRQIEIEAKIVEVVSSNSFDYGVRRVDDTTPIFGLPNPGTLVNGIDFSFPNTVDGPEAVFGLHSIFDGVELNALLEMLATEEHVSIISRPKVAVREDARAEIVNTKRVPFVNIPALNSNGTFTTALSFKQVGVQMYIVPHVIGDSMIALNVDIEASQQTGTAVALGQAGSGGGAVVLVPEISRRTAHTTVRLEPGQAVVLGGLITKRNLERERKIPLLGDIPLLGYLFKSHYQVQEEVNLLFFIRPRILQRFELHQDF